jgi:hypothetical protein
VHWSAGNGTHVFHSEFRIAAHHFPFSYPPSQTQSKTIRILMHTDEIPSSVRQPNHPYVPQPFFSVLPPPASGVRLSIAK